MEKNNTQLTTKEYKKLRCKLKFILWANKTFTRDNVMAAIHGILLGIAAAFMYISFINGNLLGGFGFMFAALVGSISWTSYLISVEKKDKTKEKFSFSQEETFKILDLLVRGVRNGNILNNYEEKNKNK